MTDAAAQQEPLPFATRRLVLRRFIANDLNAFLAYRNDPKIARYQSWEGCSLEEGAEFVRKQSTQPFGVPGEWLQIGVALKDSNQLIGDCAVRIHAADPRQALIGGTLARQFHRRGFASEALSGLLELLFERAQLRRITADTDTENKPTWQLMERLGMRREGHLRQSLWFKGRWVDEYLYAMLNEEWRLLRKPADSASA